MKVERWYDIKCDYCGRHLSSDFFVGMLTSRKEAIMYAKRNGFKEDKNNKKIICPICICKKEIEG